MNRRNENPCNPELDRTSDTGALLLPRPRLTVLPLLVLAVAFIFANACGRRGDPVAVAPSREIGVVINLHAVEQPDSVRLVWELPERKGFSLKEIKNFIVFRAEVPDGVVPEECVCKFRTIDFISPDSEPQPSLFQRLRNRFGRKPRDNGKTYEYIDKQALEGVSYVYKIVIMDRKNRMGKGSGPVFVDRTHPGPEKTEGALPGAPTGLVALYTQESIVLTWDEITDQAVSFYRIYRSEGEDFSVIGESVTPAFSDTNVAPRKKYYYRISAVSDVEGAFSEHIEVVTEPR
jgi:hypothetical protein